MYARFGGVWAVASNYHSALAAIALFASLRPAGG